MALFSKEDFVNSLQNKVNDGLLNYSNHTQDNSFFEDSLSETVKKMREREYEPVGISLNPPFPCAAASFSIAFVMRFNEKIYWVHMPETYWLMLLSDHYGRKHARLIVDEIIG